MMMNDLVYLNMNIRISTAELFWIAGDELKRTEKSEVQHGWFALRGNAIGHLQPVWDETNKTSGFIVDWSHHFCFIPDRSYLFLFYSGLITIFFVLFRIGHIFFCFIPDWSHLFCFIPDWSHLFLFYSGLATSFLFYSGLITSFFDLFRIDHIFFYFIPDWPHLHLFYSVLTTSLFIRRWSWKLATPSGRINYTSILLVVLVWPRVRLWETRRWHI